VPVFVGSGIGALATVPQERYLISHRGRRHCALRTSAAVPDLCARSRIAVSDGGGWLYGMSCAVASGAGPSRADAMGCMGQGCVMFIDRNTFGRDRDGEG